MVIYHNMNAENAHRNMKVNNFFLQKNMEKLSSGLRINHAADDASGLSISEKMRAQVRGLRQAGRNAQDGVSLLQTAEGFLKETGDILQRLRELAVQSANGIYTYEDRLQIQTEVQQLVDEIERVASQAEFNTLKLLRGAFRRFPGDQNYSKAIHANYPYDPEKAKTQGNPPVRSMPDGSPVEDPFLSTPVHNVPGSDAVAPAGSAAPVAQPSSGEQQGGQAPAPAVATPGMDDGGVYIHLGPNMDHREKIYIENMSAYALGLVSGPEKSSDTLHTLTMDYTTQNGANQAIATLDTAMYLVSRERSNIGSFQRRLEFATLAIENSTENLVASESRIRDLDMAKEMVDKIRNQILFRTSSAMFAQANLIPQILLRVLE